MSSNVTHAKEPLFRMVKRDAIPQKKAWMIRAAAFLLSLHDKGSMGNEDCFL